MLDLVRSHRSMKLCKKLIFVLDADLAQELTKVVKVLASDLIICSSSGLNLSELKLFIWLLFW